MMTCQISLPPPMTNRMMRMVRLVLARPRAPRTAIQWALARLEVRQTSLLRSQGVIRVRTALARQRGNARPIGLQIRIPRPRKRPQARLRQEIAIRWRAGVVTAQLLLLPQNSADRRARAKRRSLDDDERYSVTSYTSKKRKQSVPLRKLRMKTHLSPAAPPHPNPPQFHLLPSQWARKQLTRPFSRRNKIL